MSVSKGKGSSSTVYKTQVGIFTTGAICSASRVRTPLQVPQLVKGEKLRGTIGPHTYTLQSIYNGIFYHQILAHSCLRAFI